MPRPNGRSDNGNSIAFSRFGGARSRQRHIVGRVPGEVDRCPGDGGRLYPEEQVAVGRDVVVTGERRLTWAGPG